MIYDRVAWLQEAEPSCDKVIRMPIADSAKLKAGDHVTIFMIIKIHMPSLYIYTRHWCLRWQHAFSFRLCSVFRSHARSDRWLLARPQVNTNQETEDESCPNNR